MDAAGLSVHERQTMEYFKFHLLDARMQLVVKPYRELARLSLETLPPNSQRGVCVSKLLEAADRAVEAVKFEAKGKGRKR